MGTNQGDRQASVRGATGTAWTYEGDWHALFDAASIPAGDFNGRLLAWINGRLGTSYSEINGAMYAFAVSQGFSSWGEMGVFSALGLRLQFAGMASGADLTAAGVTYTRSQQAQLVDVTGQTTYGPNNIILQSLDIGGAGWSDSSDGITTPVAGERIINFTTDFARVFQDVAVTAGVKYMFRVEVKQAPSGSATNMRVTTNNTLAWNSGASTKIALTSSYQWLTLVHTAGAGDTSVRCLIGQPDATGTSDPQCVGSVQIRRARLSAVTYETSPRTVDDVETTVAAYYGPRFDYDAATHAALGLLYQPATITESASFTIPAGVSSIRYTFDNATTQDAVVTPLATYTIPSGLNRARIKLITSVAIAALMIGFGYATFGGSDLNFRGELVVARDA